MSDLGDLLDPALVAQIDKLEVVARRLVEGFMRGLHMSAAKGSSTEFAEYRPYVPGDDIRHLDWRLVGKTDRTYLKQYEAETNLRAVLIVDTSASMGFAATGLTKLRYASSLAAALGYLLHHQRDSVGLALVSNEVERFIPPRGTADHLTGIFRAMEETTPQGATALGDVLHTTAERIHTGSLVLIFSDFLDDPRSILSGLSHLRHRRSEVLAFHIVDPAEEHFPFDNWVIFEDMEHPGARVRLDAREVREVYLQSLWAHRDELRQECTAAEVDYLLLKTDTSFDVPLARFLQIRSRR